MTKGKDSAGHEKKRKPKLRSLKQLQSEFSRGRYSGSGCRKGRAHRKFNVPNENRVPDGTTKTIISQAKKQGRDRAKQAIKQSKRTEKQTNERTNTTPDTNEARRTQRLPGR